MLFLRHLHLLFRPVRKNFQPHQPEFGQHALDTITSSLRSDTLSSGATPAGDGREKTYDHVPENSRIFQGAVPPHSSPR